MKKYFINDEEVEEEKFNSELEDAVSNHVVDNYDDILDECYPVMTISGITFTASEILKNCNSVTYRCGIADEISAILEEVHSALDCNESVFYDRRKFEIEEIEDDDEEE